MSPRPRFRPLSASRRLFVDREVAFDAFEDEIDATRRRPRLLNFTGVGGIGKSRLLAELQRRCQPDHRTALLDLQLPQHRQQDVALIVLRRELGAQHVRFDRFDIAYAALWQRLHPHLRLEERHLPLIQESEILAELADSATGLPAFGTAVGLLRTLEKVGKRVRRWQVVRSDHDLEALDGLPNAELIDAVTYFFAKDLEASTDDGQGYVLFVDAYEALHADVRTHGDRIEVDAWLRDLCAQLTQGLTVIASREPLKWAAIDPEWEPIIRHVALDDLYWEARIQFLESAGVSGQHELQAIASSSNGVPFYLHLAADTKLRAESEQVTAAISTAEILDRFLRHVEPTEARTLELLSVARIFDHAIFQAITREFHLPAHELAWESLIQYSFVFDAGGDRKQLHQLMVSALRSRISPAATAGVHRLLHTHWEIRTAEAGQMDHAVALREAAYHGLRSGTLDGMELLGYADRIATVSISHGLIGMIDDCVEWLRGVSDPDPGIVKAINCLRAETLLLRGRTHEALVVAERATGDPEDPIASRCGVTYGHAERILGNTDRAGEIYRGIWARGNGHSRLLAGVWAADIDMVQGRFPTALEIARAVARESADDAPKVAGHAHRLLYLAYRFLLRIDEAAEHLQMARDLYHRGGDIEGQANVLTNEVELLAWTDPHTALQRASKALEAQTLLGVDVEVGKIHTAVAHANLLLGQTDRAFAALELAHEALERAQYRSGMARAEFVRAFVLARQGRSREAIASAVYATDELEAVNVYPTLAVIAELLAERIGWREDVLVERAARARQVIQPPDQDENFDERALRAVDRLLGQYAGTVQDPITLYRRALAASDSPSGFYNLNVRVQDAERPVLVRVPRQDANEMDLRIWDEQAVLEAIQPYLTEAPRVLLSSAEPRFQVHEFIEGSSLDRIAPRGKPVPAPVIPAALRLFAKLQSVPLTALPALPPGWPADGDTSGFARVLMGVTQRVFERFRVAYAWPMREFGIPSDPLGVVRDRWSTLSERPFCLVHTDVHRKNIILTGDRVVFLDWELALWGDPVYDLAVHLHKIAYLANEELAMVSGWAASMPAEATHAWSQDLATYMAHERVKSAVVDSVRYVNLFASERVDASLGESVLDRYTSVLAMAYEVWELSRPPLDKERVEWVLREAGKHVHEL